MIICLINFKLSYANLYEWHCEIIRPIYGTTAANFAALDLDNDDTPHIAYGTWDEFFYDGLEYAYKSTDGWQGLLIDSMGLGSYCLYPSLALDTYSHAHICCSVSNGFLKYAFWNGESLKTEVVDDSCNGCCHIIVDLACHPHISYHAVAIYYC